MSELSIHELETQHGELLPERETLGFYPPSRPLAHSFHVIAAEQEHRRAGRDPVLGEHRGRRADRRRRRQWLTCTESVRPLPLVFQQMHPGGDCSSGSPRQVL